MNFIKLTRESTGKDILINLDLVTDIQPAGNGSSIWLLSGDVKDKFIKVTSSMQEIEKLISDKFWDLRG